MCEILIRCCAAATAILVSSGATLLAADSRSDGEISAISLATLHDEVLGAKQRLLMFPGGMDVTCEYYAVEDPTQDFGFSGKATIRAVWLWPKLYISVDAIDHPDGGVFHRVSVYDFERHETTAYDATTVHIFPNRHMFSSAFSLLFRGLQWGEGYQSYRYGTENPDLMTVPEVLLRPSYAVVGVEDLDGERCLHVANEGSDDLWLAVDHGWLTQRRRQRFSAHGALREMSEISGYQEISPDVWLPATITTTQYREPKLPDEPADQVFKRLRLDVVRQSHGDVSPSQFELELPKGARVTDLINKKRYYNDRPFDEVVQRPSIGWSIFLWAQVAILLTVVSLLVLNSRRRKNAGTKP